MHVGNLTILANYLDTVPQPRFDMLNFAKDEHGDHLDPNQLHECNTVCCAAGSGPLAGIPVLPGDRDWDDYVERVFDIEALSEEWDWCFHGVWAHLDNTPAGAARRIRHMIALGHAPLNTFAQMHGDAPYECAADL